MKPQITTLTPASLAMLTYNLTYDYATNDITGFSTCGTKAFRIHIIDAKMNLASFIASGIGSTCPATLVQRIFTVLSA